MGRGMGKHVMKKKGRRTKEMVEEWVFLVLMAVSTLIVCGAVITIASVVLWKGLPSLSIEMLTSTPEEGILQATKEASSMQ